MFKKLLKNEKESPKSTKNGLWFSLFTLLIGVLVVKIGEKHPDMAKFIEENTLEIYGAIVSLVSVIAVYFSGKKDES